MEVSEQIRGFLEDGAGGCEGCGVVCVLEVLFDVGLEHEEFFFCFLLLVLF